jgi:hypothetical protein
MAFIHLVAMPLFRLVEPFRGFDDRWAIVPLVPHIGWVAVTLVYGRQYSVSLVVDMPMSCKILVPKVGLSAFLVSGFHEPPFLAKKQGNWCVIQLPLEEIGGLRQVMESICDLISAIRAEGFSEDVATLTFKKTIGAYRVEMSLPKGRVKCEVEGCDAINKHFDWLAQKALDLPRFVSSAVHLLDVGLSAEGNLLSETLKLLAGIAEDIGVERLCSGMASAVLENDGQLSMEFAPSESVRFRVPYGPDAPLEMDWSTNVERVRGIDAGVSILRHQVT